MVLMSGLTILALSVILGALVFASWFFAPGPWATLIIALWRRSAGLKSQFAETRGIRWHHLQGGKGPVLLLLHGFGADADCWLRLVPLLRPQFSFLIPDLPGFGRSAPPGDLEFGIEAQAERLTRFLDTLGIDHCIVVGNSMGGYLATALAARQPDRVRALWLLAPLGVRSVSPGQYLDRIDSGDLDYLQISSVRQFREKIVPSMFTTRLHVPGPLLRDLANTAISLNEVMPRMLHEVRFESEPLEAIAARVQCPVLIQWGQDDKVVNPAGLSVLAKAFADSTAALTSQCGHLPMLERPRESAARFRRFLEAKHVE
jgi:abhydrolase domain-containing protein 6